MNVLIYPNIKLNDPIAKHYPCYSKVRGENLFYNKLFNKIYRYNNIINNNLILYF